MLGRGALAAALLGASLIACGVSSTRPSPAPTPTPPESGVLQVAVGDQVESKPPNENVAALLSRALELAQGNGSDIGYPWIDPITGELVLSAVTSRGRDLINAANISVPHRIREVTHGAAELRQIQDDVTFLHSRGVPDSELIFATIPDHRDNRTLIVMRAVSPGLVDYLTTHYPADALAIQVDPSGGGGGF
jgi:hypothetical protein